MRRGAKEPRPWSARGQKSICLSVDPSRRHLLVCLCVGSLSLQFIRSLHSHMNCTHVGLLIIPVARRVSTLIATSLCWDVWPKLNTTLQVTGFRRSFHSGKSSPGFHCSKWKPAIPRAAEGGLLITCRTRFHKRNEERRIHGHGQRSARG